MAVKTIEKAKKLKKRKLRSKRGMVGTAEKPRMFVSKSLKHIYVQLIDDVGGRTLATVSDLTPDVRSQVEEKDKKTEVASKVGNMIAEVAKQKGIEEIVFDRGGFRYHGRIKALAEGARKSGLRF